MNKLVTKSRAFVNNRWDFGFQISYQNKLINIDKGKFETKPLGELIHDDSYGILTPGNVYSPENEINYIRVTDMRPHMEIDFSSVLKVPEKYFKSKRARVKRNDILLAIKGASIASDKSVAFVSDIDQPTIVNGTIFRFQVKPAYDPLYIATILESDKLKEQIKNIQVSNNAVSYVDKPSIHSLDIPTPPLKVQKEISTIIKNAYAERKVFLKEANQLFTSIEEYLFEKLNVKLENIISKKNRIESISKLRNRRFDYTSLNSNRIQDIINDNWITVGDVITHIDSRITPAIDCPDKSINFIGLVNILSHRGEIVDFKPKIGRTVLSSSPLFKKGDILFGKMRPYLNKVVIAPFDGICSGEIAVLRPKINSSLIHNLFLSKLTLEQLVPLQRGTSLPRIYVKDILNIKLPIPKELSLQNKIAGTLAQKKMEYNHAIYNSVRCIDEAKEKINKIIWGN